MFYSLFHCSLLLALFPPFGSFTTCFLLRYYTLHVTLSRSAGSSNPRSSSRHHTLHVTLSRSAGSSTTCSSLRCHTLLATLPRSAGSFNPRSTLRCHTLRITQSLSPRHPLTLQNPPQHPLFCNPKNHGRRCEKA